MSNWPVDSTFRVLNVFGKRLSSRPQLNINPSISVLSLAIYEQLCITGSEMGNVFKSNVKGEM